MGCRAQNPLSFPLAQKRGSHGTVFAPWVFRFACLPLLLFLANCQSQPRLRVIAQEVTPTIQAAAEALAAHIEQAGYETEVATGPEASAAQVNAVILTVDESAPDLQPEGFRILPIHAGGYYLFQVIGKDQRGVLWGSQELAEQIASSGRLETVITQTANRRLPLRAIALPLHLPEASDSLEATSDPRTRWSEQVALLSRSRFNAVFLRTTQPLIRFVPVPGEPDAPATVTDEIRAHGDWLRDLFAIARDHGLDCYLWITPASLEGWPAAVSDAESADPIAQSSLAKGLPAIFSSYPDLGGVVLDPDLIPPGDPLGRDLVGRDPSARNIWLAENVLAPLADSEDQRPVFLSVGGDAWPSRNELSALAPDGRIRLLASLPPATEPLPESGYPVLWRLDLPPSELRPWDNPAAAGAALRRIGARDPLGFLDVSWLSPDDFDSASPEPTPDLDDSWFRLLLLGRMGYSPDLPEQYWVQQFADRFGSRAGLQVYAAASHASRILDALPREAPSSFPLPDELAASTTTDPIRLFGMLRSFLSEQEQDFSTGVVLAEALRERNWTLPGQPLPPETPATAASLEPLAREVLAQTEEAGRFGAWRDPANQRFLLRIQTVADAGLALGERHRAALALARFLLGGEEADRQQALSLLQSVQQRIATEGTSGSPRLLGPLEDQTTAVLQAIPNLAPWQRERTVWEVGMVEGWTAAYPDPLQWTSAETASLREFGLFGLQLWMSSINQRSRPAFLVPAAGPPLGSESYFVARTMISIPSSGQMVLRLLSGQPGTVWVNGRPAAPLSPAQFPWPVGSPPPPHLLAQLFAQTVPPGPAEVIVSIPAPATEGAAVALQSTFAATARVPLQINAAAALQLVGGVAFVPSAGASLQPHLALFSPQDGEPQADTAERSTTQADFLFAIRDPGFYRMRLWSFWETSPSSGLDISLDGSSLSRNVGLDDPTTGRWHWVPVDTIAALGTGEHRLRITGWSAGTRVGIVEISQQDALLPGS